MGAREISANMITRFELDAKQLVALTYACSAISCLSLFFVAIPYGQFHITYYSDALLGATLTTLAFASVSWLFGFSRFCFGYLIGFYLYIMILGYLWLNSFSPLPYNHALPGLSAVVSAIAFLLPALLIYAPIRQVRVLSIRSVDHLLTLILLVAIATVAAGAYYNFKIVGIERIYEFRDALAFPTALSYLIGITSSSLLPFAFACFVLRGNVWRAGLVALLMLLFYPITLAKISLFAPVWIVGMTIASRIIDSRTTVVLSLFIPVSIGVIFFTLHNKGVLSATPAMTYFELVNFRMIAIPSLAMDYYNYFFSTHELTRFCQVRVLKAFLSCPYQDQLSVVIYKFFGIGGFFNASLFATEGVASVGSLFAPLTAFACGLVIAFGNRLSAGLPDRFILISGAVISQAFLNVPFTTVMLSHGAGLLFLLWYLMPREMFEVDRKTRIG